MIAAEQIKHVMFTRLNLHYLKLKDPHAWMEHRFKVFIDYTVPSVLAQTTDNFEWVVAVDPDTPDETMARLKNFQQRGKMSVMVANKNVSKKYSIILESQAADDTYVVSTRLDSDDILHPQFIETVQANLEGDHKVINLDIGAVWMINEGRARMVRHMRNMFISRVSRPGQPVGSVLAYKHGEMCSRFKTHRVVTRHPMWIIIVHGLNKINSSRIAHGKGVGDYINTTRLKAILNLRFPPKKK